MSKRYNCVLFFLLALNIAGCSTLPTGKVNEISYAFQDTESTRLGKTINNLLVGKQEKTGVLPLSSGLDAFSSRYLLTTVAEKSIDVQYYIWHYDTTGKLLLHSLLEAANRGVRIRLLLDDITTDGKDAIFTALNQHKNIQVRLFNPFANRDLRAIDMITDFSRINRRMHNKSFTVDNQVTIVGGRNVGNEYFDANLTVDFHDFDLLAIGKVVNDVSSQFDQYWNHDLAIPIHLVANHSNESRYSLAKELKYFHQNSKKSQYANAVRDSKFISRLKNKKLPFYWNEAKVLYDHPDKIRVNHNKTKQYLRSKLIPFFKNLENEFIAISPYFIPGDTGVEKIAHFRKNGVNFNFLTNSLASTDVPIVYSGYAPYRIPLLENGVDLYEIKDTAQKSYKKEVLGSTRSSLHSKIYLFDRKHIFVGSFNLDPRSININTEMGLMVLNTEMAKQIGQWWDNSISKIAYKLDVEYVEGEHGKEAKIVWYDHAKNPAVRFEEAPNADFWQTFSSDVLSILPLESQL